MNKYTEKFKKLIDKELVELLSDFESLNSDAKEALYDLINDKPALQNENYNALKAEVEYTKLKLYRLEYLRNLGFKAQFNEEIIRISRSKSAIITDVVGAILGVCLLLALISAIDNFKTISSIGINGLILLEFVINVSLGLVGFGLFYKTINRLVEYWGFKIVKDDSSLTISKQGELTVESILSKSTLGLDVFDGGAILYIGEDKKPLIATRGTPIFVKTLEETYKKLSK